MRTLTTTLSALFILAAAHGASAQEAKQDFTLVNATGYTIDQVFVAPTKSDDWEEDVLGRDQLANKEYVNIHFARANKTCLWDLKVVYDDNTAAEWTKFDLCSVSKITIKYDRASDTTSAVYE